MRSTEVARAIPGLVRSGVLDADGAAPLLAVASGRLVSVRGELRALLGIGVVALTAAVGLLLEEHHRALGPGGIAIALALAAAGTLWAARRRVPAFGWRRAESQDWLVDGLLLLAIGLLGADLAWIETQFTALGPQWPWHLLAMSLVTAALAIRFDSIAAWSLALSTFAAWRGVAMSGSADQLERTLFRGDDGLRWNLLVCALVFAVAGWALERLDRKRHFEPATTFLAALVAGIGLVSGLGERSSWELWTMALATLGTLVAWRAFQRRRLALFALGALGLYIAVTRALFELPGAGGIGCFWFALSSLGAVVLLIRVHRRFRTGAKR